MSDIPRAPAYQSRAEFDALFRLHEKQPWTMRKLDELYMLLGECTEYDQQILILDLLSRYENFDEIRSNNVLLSLRDKIIFDWGLTPENTIIVALHKKTSPGSAQAILQAFKNKFAATSWSSSNFIAFENPAVAATKSNMNVVFIDDFIGTGSQFCSSFDRYKSSVEVQCSGVSFYLVSMCMMTQSIYNIEARGVEHHSGLYMEKALEGVLSGAALAKANDQMAKMEKNLEWRNDAQRNKYSRGFEQSEALFRYMDNNSPNNNFPIFWWSRRVDGKTRATMQDRL